MSVFQWGGFGGNRPQSQPQQTSFAAPGYRPPGGQPQQTSFAAPGGIRPMPGRNNPFGIGLPPGGMPGRSNPFGMMNPGSFPPGWSGPSQYPIARPSMSKPWRMPGSNSMPGEHPIRTADIQTQDWKMPLPESNPWRNDTIGPPPSDGINQAAHDAMLKSQMGQQGQGPGGPPGGGPSDVGQQFGGGGNPRLRALEQRMGPEHFQRMQQNASQVATGQGQPQGTAEADRAASYGGTQLQKHRRRGFGGFGNRMLGKAIQNAPGAPGKGLIQSGLNKGPAGQVTQQNHRGQQNQNATPTTMKHYGQSTFGGRG